MVSYYILLLDGCRSNTTLNKVPDSNDTSLDWDLKWPETDIGQTVNMRYNDLRFY